MRATFNRPKPESPGRESPTVDIELKEIGTPVLISTTATVYPEPPPLPSSEQDAPKPKQTMASDLAKALALRREAMGWDS